AHPFVPGTQTPEQTPFTHAFGHCRKSIHWPVAEHWRSVRPEQVVAFGMHSGRDVSTVEASCVTASSPPSIDAPPVDEASVPGELPPVALAELPVVVPAVVAPPAVVVLVVVPVVVATPAPPLPLPLAASWPTELASS